MAVMTTVTRSRKVSDVRGLDRLSPEGELARVLDVEALGASAALLGAIEHAREERKQSKADIANALGLQRTAVSRLLEEDGANPTIRTLTRLLWAVGLHADIALRPRGDQDDHVLEVSEEQ